MKLFKVSLCSALVIILLSAGLCSAYTITTYTDENQWNTAVAARASWSETETFDNSVYEPWLSITSDGGGSVVAFQWQSIVDSNPVKNDTFSFSLPGIFAWCGTFDLPTPGGAGEGINVYANLITAGGYSEAYLIANNYAGFVGFVITGDEFTSVQLRGGGNPLGVQETYWLDDMSIAGVPEPMTMLLLGLGLVGLAGVRRFK